MIKLRILMLNNEFPPLGGGTGVVNYHILKELAIYSDIWIDLITSSRSRHRFETVHFSKRIKIFKVPVHNRNIHHATNAELMRYFFLGLQASRKLLRQQKYDLSFAFSGVPAGAISYLLKQSSSLPYLVSLQGPDVPGFEARYDYLYPVLRPILRIIWRNSVFVTAISGEHQRLAAKTMPNLNIPIIYNGVDTKTFFPSEKPLNSEVIKILCVGRLIERKGQHHLLRSFSDLLHKCNLQLKLILVGTGDMRERLISLALNLGVEKHVEFKEFIDRERMPEVYRQADIFVLPSQNEGMSIALLEAMASGLPVIVTNTGGTEELVRQGENGLIVPWASEQTLTEALIKLASDGHLRKSMGRKGLEIAKNLDWGHIAQQYMSLFLHAIKADLD
jgi:phosphatidylinositol alpha-1,6-mannosyltransferase